MKELRLDTDYKLKESELLYLKENVNNIIPNTSKNLINKFTEIINFNIDQKEEPKIDSNNRKRINDYLKEFLLNNQYIKNKNIYIIFIKSNIIYKTKKLTLLNLYQHIYKNKEYRLDIQNILENENSISYIKIYDFYRDVDEVEKFIDKLKINNDIKELILLLKKKNSNAKIKILTHLNSEKSYNFYKSILYNNMGINNITIKYIPESISKNIYISSLFYLLIKYKIPNSSNYKTLVLYLEPNTNWGVITNTYSTGFSTQFIKLLNMRFDQQYEDQLYFEPLSKELRNEDFENDIEQLLKDINNKICKTDYGKLDENILKDIHKLKIKYMKMNNSYKLLKSYFYFMSYLNIIKTITKQKELPHTNIILNIITKNNYYSNIKNIINEIILRNTGNTEKNIKNIRKTIISEINNSKAICDVFPEMNWLNLYNIKGNLIKISLDENLLDKFFEEIKMKKNLTLEDKKNLFNSKIAEKILKGIAIKL